MPATKSRVTVTTVRMKPAKPVTPLSPEALAKRRANADAKKKAEREARQAAFAAAMADPEHKARILANMERQAQLASKPRVEEVLTPEQRASEAEDDWTFNVPRAIEREYGTRR